MVTHFVFEGCSHVPFSHILFYLHNLSPFKLSSCIMFSRKEIILIVVGLLLFSPSFSGTSWSSVSKARHSFSWEFSSIYWNITITQVSASHTPYLWITVWDFLQCSHTDSLNLTNPFLQNNFFSIPCLCGWVFLQYSGSRCLPFFFSRKFYLSRLFSLLVW